MQARFATTHNVRQNAHVACLAHTAQQDRWPDIIKKSSKVHLSKSLSVSPLLQPQHRKASLNSSCKLLQTISAKSRTVSWSGSERRRESEGGRQRRVLVHNYSRDLWPEKQFINHSAWANVLQIALHAAAILAGVKRHNKPGWRTFSGVPELGENLRLWVVA